MSPIVSWRVHPLASRTLSGSARMPGDKSISHRAIILRALAGEGDEHAITGLLESEDVASSRRVIASVLSGAASTRDAAPEATAPAICDCGNSGTTIRIMLGALAGRVGVNATLDGDASLRRRPMERVAAPLREMGAEITTTSGKPPVTVRGRRLVGRLLTCHVASAQVKSSLLLAGLHAEGRTVIHMPEASRDHTERMLAAFGVRVETLERGRVVSIEGGQRLTASPVNVPGDISSAAFFLVAGILVPGANLVLENVGVNPLRTGILDVIDQAGGFIAQRAERVITNEPRADLLCSHQSVGAIRITAIDVPRLIDEIPIIALLAAHADATESLISGAEELRVKESDRIDAICGEFAAIGLVAHPRPDGLVIPGRQSVRGGTVRSRGDHRIAMTAAIAGLISSAGVEVQDVACVETSFPGFVPLLTSLGAEIEVFQM